MKRIAIFMAAALVIGTSASAQRAERRSMRNNRTDMVVVNADRHDGRHDNEVVKVISAESAQVGEPVNLEFYINYDRLDISPREQHVVTPSVTDGERVVMLRPVVFVGEKRYNRQLRNNDAYGTSAGEATPYETVILSRKDIREMRRAIRNNEVNTNLTSGYAMKYVTSFPFQPWMNGSEVVLNRKTGMNDRRMDTYAGDFGTLYNVAQPQVVFVQPEIETVKARSDKMTARVIFRQDHADIDRRVSDNAEEMRQIFAFTDKIMNDRNLKVDRVRLVGYASPEGTVNHNNKLSMDRARTLADTIASKYNVETSRMQISNVAEDWDSVSRWVAKSDLRYKTQVLDIISSTTDQDARDAKIRALDNGATYRRLLDEAYPGIRRTEYEIDYTVQPFTVEQGRQVIRTNPSHLSLYEIYQVAESYPVGSDDYIHGYTVAVRHFPEDHVANNNMAAMALKRGDRMTARMHLEKCREYEKAINNLGVLEAMEGNYETAERYFREAASHGIPEAQYNLENLHAMRF